MKEQATKARALLNTD